MNSVDAINAVTDAANLINNAVKKAGMAIAEYLISKNGNITKNTEEDINKMIRPIPEELRDKVLMIAMLQVAKNVSGFSSSKSNSSKSSSTKSSMGGFSSFLGR